MSLDFVSATLCYTRNRSGTSLLQCLPGNTSLVGPNGTCCCVLDGCGVPVPDVWRSVAAAVVATVFLGVVYKRIMRGIRYKRRNIPFYLAALFYAAPERVRWADPWRDQSTPELAERGYFKTKAALEIYVQRKHGKSREDLARFWHEHPEEAGGLTLPAWQEAAFPRFVVFGVVTFLTCMLAPMLVLPVFGVTLYGKMVDVHLFCHDHDLDELLVSLVLIVLGFYGYDSAFTILRFNNWRQNHCTRFLFAIALFQLYFVFVLHHWWVDQPQTAEFDFTTNELLFFIPEMMLTVHRTYLNSEQGLPVNIALLLKRFRNKHIDVGTGRPRGAPKVWIVSGCPKDDSRMQDANGVYFRSPCVHVERNIRWSRVVGWTEKRKRSKARDTPRTRGDGGGAGRKDGGAKRPTVDLPEVDEVPAHVGDSVQVRFGKGARRRVMVGRVVRLDVSRRRLDVAFGVELGACDGAPVYVKIDWSARPGRQRFSFKIMRVATPALRNQPHWVLVDNRHGQALGGLGGQVRYAARDMSNRAVDEPPPSGWHSLSEDPANQGVPTVVSWDAAHFSVDRNAREKRAAVVAANRKKIALSYLAWMVVLGSFVLFVSVDDCKFTTPGAAGWPVALIVWVELATPLMAGVGLQVGPLKLCLFHLFVRVLIVLTRLNQWFLAGCVIYLLFACAIGRFWAQGTYPVQTVRQVLKEELRGALPQWMFDGTAAGEEDGGGAEGDDDAVVGNFVEHKVLQDAVFSPLLKLADYFDCIAVGLGAIGGANTSGGGCKTCCTGFLASASFVLLYLTLLFCGATAVVFVHQDLYPAAFPIFDPKTKETVTTEQWEIGVMTVLVVFAWTATMRFLFAYDYYGHRKNRLPHIHVMYESVPMILCFWSFAAFTEFDLAADILFTVSLVAPTAVATTKWMLENWKDDDYTLLFKSSLHISGGLSALVSPLKSLKGKLGQLGDTEMGLSDAHALASEARNRMKAIVARLPTAFGLVVGPLGHSVVLGVLLFYYTPHSVFAPWTTWAIIGIINVVFFTYLLLVVYNARFEVNLAVLAVLVVSVGVLSASLGMGSELRCVPVDEAATGLGRTAHADSIQDPICATIFNTSTAAIAAGVVGKNCTQDADCLAASPNSVCREMPPATVACPSNSTLIGNSTLMAHVCDCRRWEPFGIKLDWTRLYYGNNCEYKPNGWSAGMPLPYITLLWALYAASMCIGIAIYKWWSLSFRYKELRRLRKYFVSAAVCMFVWLLFFVFTGAKELSVGIFFGEHGSSAAECAEKSFLSTRIETAIIVLLLIVTVGAIWIRWVSNGFRFSRCTRIVLRSFVLIIVAYYLWAVIVVPTMEQRELERREEYEKITLLVPIRLVFFVLQLGSLCDFLRLSQRTGLHYAETVYPVLYVDAKTNKMRSLNAAVHRGLAFCWLLIFDAVTEQLLAGNQESPSTGLPSALLKYLLGFSGIFILLSDRAQTSAISFTKAWREVRNNTVLVDRLRAQTIDAEMKATTPHTNETAPGGHSVRSPHGWCQTATSELNMLLATSQHHPWETPRERVTFDTVDACLRAVGKVPAEMPAAWECFSKRLDTVEKRSIAAANRAAEARIRQGDDDDNAYDDGPDHPELLVSAAGHSAVEGVYTFLHDLKAGDVTDGFPVFQLVNGELGAGCFITVKMIDEGWGGAELYWVILHGETLVYKAHAGFHKDDILHCSSAGRQPGLGRHGSFRERLRSRVETRASARELSGLGPGRRSVATSFGSVASGGTNTDSIMGHGRDGPAIDLPPEHGWSACVDEAEPAPHLLSTELKTWQRVYRAANGIMRFDRAMDRLQYEEQKLVARFRLLLIQTAKGQQKVEGAVLWNFVSECIPKLEQIVEQETIHEYYDEHLEEMIAEKAMARNNSTGDSRPVANKNKTAEFMNPLLPTARIAHGEHKSSSLSQDASHSGGQKATDSAPPSALSFTVVNRFRQPEKKIRMKFGVSMTGSCVKSRLARIYGVPARRISLVVVNGVEQPGNGDGVVEDDGRSSTRKKGKKGKKSLQPPTARRTAAEAAKQVSNSACTHLEDGRRLGDYAEHLHGSRVLMIEKFNLADMSPYELKTWLFDKRPDDPRKPRRLRILLQLGRTYAADIVRGRMRQQRDAAKDQKTAADRRKLMEGATPMVNISPREDAEIAADVMSELQNAVSAQYDVRAQALLSCPHAKKAHHEHENTMHHIIRVRDEALKQLNYTPGGGTVGADARHGGRGAGNGNGASPQQLLEAAQMLQWATRELKRLDIRDDRDVQSGTDDAFSRALESRIVARRSLQNQRATKSTGRWEDTEWHTKVAKGKSLTKLSKLLSAAGKKPVKIAWQSPLEMDLLWLDRAWVRSGGDAQRIWDSREYRATVPVPSGADSCACAKAEDRDLFRLQEEIVERGDYSKYCRKLSESPNKRAALAQFAGDLRCIWWLDSAFLAAARKEFPALAGSLDDIWTSLRPRLACWRRHKMAQQSQKLWYDSHHDLLSEPNEKLRMQLVELFRSGLVELRAFDHEGALAREAGARRKNTSSLPSEPDGHKAPQSDYVAETGSDRDATGSEATSEGLGTVVPQNSNSENKSAGTTPSFVPAVSGNGAPLGTELVDASIQLFIGGVDANDIRQGPTLQDCWLLSALSILAGEEGDGTTHIEDIFLNRSVGGQIVPGSAATPGADYHTVRFFRADRDEWEHVVVDDMVPAVSLAAGHAAVADGSSGPRSVYGHSREPETWVMQIEKAYAKWLRSTGGYDGLNLGLVTEALVALTGGASQEINLRCPGVQAEARSGKLWRRLVNLRQQGAMLGCGSPAGKDSFWDKNGIVQGHAYAILDMCMASIPDGASGGYRKVGMLLLRNPWGRNPWDLEPPLWFSHQMKRNPNQPWPILPLDWSPMSSRWAANAAAYVRTILNWDPQRDQATGKFWITLQDFLSHYATVFVCRVPSSFKVALRDHWSFAEGREGGVLTCPTGHQNPQWRLTVKKEGPVFISLTQGQADTLEGLKYIMLALLPQREPLERPLEQADMEKPGFFFTGRPQRQQQVSLNAEHVTPGHYLIVCCCFTPYERTTLSLGVNSPTAGALGGLARVYDDV